MENTPRSQQQPNSQGAFTLIEMVIVMMIIAILSIALAFSFGDARDRANLADYETQITNILQQARGLSLTSVLDESDEPIDYYEVSVLTDPHLIILEAGDEEITTLELPEGFEFDDVIYFYYFPPYGEVCIHSYVCSRDDTEGSFILTSPEGQQVQFTVSVYGGYPEVEDVESS